ncbi:MAG TPA: YndM family protein [Bacillus sp. (in: firmicutes)]|nr:YndM family protein [Bacillus sp. (in: firmicutes)]
MKHIMAFIIKFALVGLVVFSILGIFYNAGIMEIFMIALLTASVGYLIGDLFILPRLGNIVASIADFGLVFLSVWGLGNLFIERTVNITVASFFAALAITAIEIFFHIYYMRPRVFNEPEDKQGFINVGSNRFAAEFSEEFTKPELKLTEKNRNEENK